MAPIVTPSSSRRTTSVQSFRPNPPINGVRWCIRNNLNYQQSALLVALNFTARNGHRYLDQFYRKGMRAIERGRYIVRLAQPYGPLAKSYFSRQDVGAGDPRPYDDTGWTLQYVRNVALHPIADTAVFRSPTTKVTLAKAYPIAPTMETGFSQFQYALRDVRM